MTILQVLQATPPAQIPELDFVRNRYIENYNVTHREKVGELMYHRQVIHFKQLVAGSEQLRACDPFSLYACFATAAVNGYSLDPQDNEVYLWPTKGKAQLLRQAGAHVKRLIRTNQIVYADQAAIVVKGDEFNVMNGRVLKHVKRFQSDIMIAGYVRFIIDDKGNDRFFVYDKSDWESWRRKSAMKDGENWNTNGQPIPGFLRTKIVKHACTEKCWATGTTPVTVEQFEDIEVDDDDVNVDQKQLPLAPVAHVPPAAAVIPATTPATAEPASDDSFVGSTIPAGSSAFVDDDDF